MSLKKMNIELRTNLGFEWVSQDHIAVKGFLFDHNNVCYQNNMLANYFSDITSEDQFLHKLRQANGFFSVIIKNDNRIFAAADRIRSHTLFYSEKYGWIGDHPNSFIEKENIQKNDLSIREFYALGYVTGSDTIYTDIKQIQAGEYLVIENGQCKTVPYYSYLHKDFKDYSEKESLEVLEDIITASMKRLIKYANGRQLVVPLSGGYDSRLIVLKLKELRYHNVLCFSYGRPNNWESNISKNVADHLSLKWVFIDYESIVKATYKSESMKGYDAFAHRMVSLPHIQDFFAVKVLKEKHMIQENAVFVPGHSLDFLAGSHLTAFEYQEKILDTDDIIHRLLEKHYNLFKLNRKNRSAYLSKIKSCLSPPEGGNDNSTLLDEWNWKERQAKFIVNSCRVYEFFDYEWYCPLWDKEIMDFFRTLPMHYRIKKWLYNQYVEQLNSTLIIKEPFSIKEESIFKAVFKILNRFIVFRPIILPIQCLWVYSNIVSKNNLCLEKVMSIWTYLKLVINGHRNVNGVEIYLFMNRKN